MSAGGDLELDATSEGVALWIHVTPRARRERLGGVHAGALRIAVTAPPSEGAANDACRRCLARALGVPREAVSLDPGSKHRRKRLRVAGDPDALARRLRALAAPEPSD